MLIETPFDIGQIVYAWVFKGPTAIEDGERYTLEWGIVKRIIINRIRDDRFGFMISLNLLSKPNMGATSPSNRVFLNEADALEHNPNK